MTMYIIRTKAAKLVSYISKTEPVFTEACMIEPIVHAGISTVLHEVVQGPQPPMQFVPDLLTYDGSWSVVDEVAYQARLAILFPPPPPPDLNKRQFKLALFHAGLLDAVEAAIETLPEPDRSVARIEYADNNHFVRTDPWVAALAQVMGLSDAEIDALWLWAAGL